jgi:putative ABC transport system permease protein
MYDHQYELKLRLESDSLTIFTILFVVLLITSVVFIYFIMRSKMISNIYTIGIYRAIGATRWTLIKRFMAEAFVLALMTCFIGYVIAAGLIGFAITFLNEVFNVSILSIDWLFVIIGSGVMFVLIVFFGILPIIMLLRKTPTMICAKYDI